MDAAATTTAHNKHFFKAASFEPLYVFCQLYSVSAPVPFLSLSLLHRAFAVRRRPRRRSLTRLARVQRLQKGASLTCCLAIDRRARGHAAAFFPSSIPPSHHPSGRRRSDSKVVKQESIRATAATPPVDAAVKGTRRHFFFIYFFFFSFWWISEVCASNLATGDGGKSLCL